eukprot:5404246-Prymnesium_polylepis.1
MLRHTADDTPPSLDTLGTDVLEHVLDLTGRGPHAVERSLSATCKALRAAVQATEHASDAALREKLIVTGKRRCAEVRRGPAGRLSVDECYRLA